MGRSGSEDGRGELFGRWLVAVHGGGGSRNEIEVVVDEEEEEMGKSRRHVFDDIEVVGDRIEVKGGSFVNGGGGGGVSICIPPKNALLLMRCRSDPLKMAAIANRISSDALRYENDEEEDEVVEDDGRKIFVIQVVEKETLNNAENDKSLIIRSEEKIEEEGEEEEEEEEVEVESNMSSFEALLEQENTQNYQDSAIKDDKTRLEEEETLNSDAEKATSNGDDNQNAAKTVDENEEQDNGAVALPESTETAEVLPECLLLMMREPKLSMEVSKETWVCATDFIRLLPERPRRAAAKAAAAPAEPVKRRAAVEKSKPRVPPLPSKKNDVQPARSSCSLPAAAAAKERKRVSGGGACEPLALTRCKSEPMSTAAAKLMPEPGCWKENVGMKMEPHRQAAVGVGAAEVGV